ncbi:MAG: DUF2281 domain-containing protein [Thermoflexales bacterium]|nr:DUF2281 domain-containing protein [Thermoflexales bacterium]
MTKTTRAKSVKETRTAYRTTTRVARPIVTVPPPVREAAEQLAQQLNISLNELYTSALTAYISEHQGAIAPARRQPGSGKGLISIADDFDAPLADFAEYTA